MTSFVVRISEAAAAIAVCVMLWRLYRGWWRNWRLALVMVTACVVLVGFIDWAHGH